jgi:protease I
VKKLQFVVHDFVDGFDTYTEKPGHTWQADVAFADVDPTAYVAAVVPGGRAPEYIRNDADAQRIVRHFMTSDLPVAALCHGPLLLAAAGTLNGRRSAAYPALAPDIAVAGGEFVDGAAVVDGQLFTRSRVARPPVLDACVHGSPAQGRAGRVTVQPPAGRRCGRRWLRVSRR